LLLDDSLLQHCVGHLDEAGDVGALDVVGRVAVFAVEHAVGVDRAHDAAELLIDGLARAAEAAGVLRHLESRDGHAAGIGGLAGAIEGLGGEEDVDGTEVNAKDVVFGWLAEEVRQRDPRKRRTVVAIMDGETKLRDLQELKIRRAVGILDIRHVTEYLWKLA
jgi:hypothetical protein